MLFLALVHSGNKTQWEHVDQQKVFIVITNYLISKGFLVSKENDKPVSEKIWEMWVLELQYVDVDEPNLEYLHLLNLLKKIWTF